MSWSVTLIVRSPQSAARATSADGDSRPSDAVVCRWRSIKRAQPAAAAAAASRRGVRAPPPLPLDERAVFADQQLQMCALLVGELEEDLLALRILELVAVSLEEAVRAALALDADHQRLPVVDAIREPLGAGGEQAVRGALEEQERRPRLELRILLQAARGSASRASRDAPALPRRSFWKTRRPRVSRVMRGRARIELQAAALGGDRDAQRVAREHQLGGRRLRPSASRPVRHDSQVPWICSTLCRAVKWRAAATSSSSDSMSELRNSKERLQVVQIR